MRIAHVQHPYLPNYGYQENYLPSRQSELGHEVLIVSGTSIPPKFQNDMQKESFRKGHYRYNGVNTIRLGSWFHLSEINDVALRGLHNHLVEFEPDIIHSHGLYSPRTLQSFLHVTRKPTKLFIDVHIDNGNFNVDTIPKKVFVSLYNSCLLPLIAKKTQGFIPVNKFAQTYLKDSTSIQQDKIKFLPLGVDEKVFYPDNEKGRNIRSQLGLAQTIPLIVFAGNIEPSKNIESLLTAISSIDDEINLLLVGPVDDEYAPRLTEAIENSGLSNNVLLTGSVDHDQLPAYLNAADFGIWPGKLGITSVEAIGTGLPIIVPDDIATRYLVSHDNGLTFSGGNSRDLARKISLYLTNSQLVKKHRQNSIEFSNEVLYWDRVAEESIRIYQE